MAQTKKTTTKKALVKKGAVKKVTKKRVAKKTAAIAKKTVTKKQRTAKKQHVRTKITKCDDAKKDTHKRNGACACRKRAQQHKAFWVYNGPVVDTIMGLKEAVRTMTDEQFMYHTQRNGNDFARWIRECIGDIARAERVERAKTRMGTVRALSGGGCCTK